MVVVTTGTTLLDRITRIRVGMAILVPGTATQAPSSSRAERQMEKSKKKPSGSALDNESLSRVVGGKEPTKERSRRSDHGDGSSKDGNQHGRKKSVLNSDW